MQQGFQMAPVSPTVKKLIIVNSVLWLLVVLIFSRLWPVFETLGLVPAAVLVDFHIWQIFTYMFIHDGSSIFHILFNMLALYMFGGELERRWGSKFFLTYYIVCGVGAALIYLAGVLSYYIFTGEFITLVRPVVGASGAIFGILLAYGIIFGDRLVYFMMLFPMKAKWMVAIFGGIELVTLLGNGFQGDVANLAHLGGFISGFLYLIGYAKFKKLGGSKKPKKRKGNLRLVVDNEDDDNPRYWN